MSPIYHQSTDQVEIENIEKRISNYSCRQTSSSVWCLPATLIDLREKPREPKHWKVFPLNYEIKTYISYYRLLPCSEYIISFQSYQNKIIIILFRINDIILQYGIWINAIHTISRIFKYIIISSNLRFRRCTYIIILSISWLLSYQFSVLYTFESVRAFS